MNKIEWKELLKYVGYIQAESRSNGLIIDKNDTFIYHHKTKIKNNKDLEWHTGAILLLYNLPINEIKEMSIEERVTWIHLFEN